MDTSHFKVVCDHCDAKLASVFCHSDGAFLCPQCDAQVHSVNKLAQRHLRVPCQSCPVWAYREAKSRGRLLDMPLAACLTRNLQMDIFDGASSCWPSNNQSSAALGTPQSDTSSPQPTAVPAPPNAGSPNSPLPTTAMLQGSSSWPQNGLLAVAGASQPQVVASQGFGDRPFSPGADPSDFARAAQLGISPYSNCSGNLQASVIGQQQQEQQQQYNCQVTPASVPAQVPQPQAAQSQHSQLQRVASQEVMEAVDSMDVALLLDTFGAPLGQLQEQRKVGSTQGMTQQQQQQHHHLQPPELQQQQPAQEQLMAYQQAQQQQPMQAAETAPAMCSTFLAAVPGTSAVATPQLLPGAASWPPLSQQAQAKQLQQQAQQQLLEDQQRQARAQAGAGSMAQGFTLPSSEPMAVPAQRPQQTMRTLSGLSCMSQSGLSCSNNEGPQMGSARSSNTILLQSLEQRMLGAGCGMPITLTGVASANCWSDLQAVQRNLQQLQQQQTALQALQQQQQEQAAAAAALAAAQAQQQQLQLQQAQIQLLQRAMTDGLPRTSPINITVGSGASAASGIAAAVTRRDGNLRTTGLGLSDPGVGISGRGATLEGSLPHHAAVAAAAACGPSSTLLENLSGVQLDAMSIAAAAAAATAGPCSGNSMAMAPGPCSLPPAAHTVSVPLPGSCMSLDMAASSFGAAAPITIAGSGGSTSVSPPNYDTLAGAASGRIQIVAAGSSAQLAGSCGAHTQMILPGSAPPALGLANASAGLVSPGGSCDMSESQLMRLSSDGYDPLLGVAAASATANSLGASGQGSLSLTEAEAQGLLARVEEGGRDMDPERVAQLNRYRAKRMMRMKVLADGAKKVRYECRKQLADTRPRVRGRFAKANSSDALLDFGAGFGATASGPLPASSLNSVGAGAAGAVGGLCASAGAGLSFGNTWGLHGHGHGVSMPHMQRIDEEGANEGQSPLVSSQQQHLLQITVSEKTSAGVPVDQAAAPIPAFTGTMSQQQHHHQRQAKDAHQAELVGRMQSGNIFETAVQVVSLAGPAAGLNPGALEVPTLGSSSDVLMGGAGAGSSCPFGGAGIQSTSAVAPAATPGGGGTQEDCVITEKDLAALGFDDLLQYSGGFSNNAGNTPNEEMDESAESMNEGSGDQRSPRQPQPGLPQESQQMQTQQQMQMLQQMQLYIQPAVPQTPPHVHVSTPSPQVPLQQQQQSSLGHVNLSGAAQPLPQPQHQSCAAPQQSSQQQQQQLQKRRLSVLDRPIMYGTDRSQFSAAQLSLLDSILTDQYRPSGVGSRH